MTAPGAAATVPPAPPSRARRLAPWLVPLLLAGVVLALYGRTITFPFTNWDDPIYISEGNPYVTSLSWANVRAVFTPGKVPREQLYLPLSYLSHQLEASTLGLRPAVVHGTNVLLHLLNVLLLFALLRHWADRRTAFLAALLFAVHPLQVECVAWAMGRKDLLATAAALLALLAYLRYLRADGARWPIAAWLAFTAACLCKPTLVILPGALALLAYAERPAGPPRESFAGTSFSWHAGPRQPVAARTWLALLPFVLVSAVIYLINSRLPQQVLPHAPGLGQRLLALPWSAAGWLRRGLLLEAPLPFYGWPAQLTDTAGCWGIALGVAAGLLALLLLWVGWRRPGWGWLGAGLAILLLGALPAASIVMGGRPFLTADRYGYLAMGAAAFLVARALAALPRGRQPATLGLDLLIALAAWHTVHQVELWHDSRQLWGAVVAAQPANAFAWGNLASADIHAGDLRAAAAHYQTDLTLDPDDTFARTEYAKVLLDRGYYAEALREAHTVLLREPRNADARQVVDDLRQRLEQGLVTLHDPSMSAFPDNWITLAQAYQLTGHAAAAERCYRRGLELGPTHPAIAHYNLGQLLAGTQQPAAAILAFRAALLADPTFTPAREALTALGAVP